MKWFLSFILLILISPENLSAVVHISHNTHVSSAKNSENQKQKKYTFKNIVKKIKSVFEFDLSDPVDGWLSLAILLFAGAIICGLLNWLVGGLYLLGLLTTLLAVLGLGSFVIWIIKTVG